jgi:catechol 2,3-dioxygenase-like lactoylglutathione lyase family enzyme
MPIRELFHFMHLVDDFDPVHDRYEQLLAPKDWGPKSWSDFDKRWATLGNVGPDFVLEIMEPGKDAADAGAPLPKFHSRHGDHLHSFAWYVDADDMVGLMETMDGLGVRVITPYPRSDPNAAIGTFFTHPKNTFGQLEFSSLAEEARNSSRDLHLHSDWTGDFWRDELPIGLERTSHLTLVVDDIEAAKTFYDQGLSAPAFHEEESDDRLSAFCLVGNETVVELAHPKSPTSWIGKDLAEHGNIPHAMTFKVVDLAAAEKHVTGLGIGIAWRSEQTIVLDPADMANAVVGFTVRQLPGDPRV